MQPPVLLWVMSVPRPLSNKQWKILLVGSCSTQDDGHLYSVKHHASMYQLLEDHLRRKLKFFFMNPCEKFWARGRKPWKLGIQILKIAMVTIQLVVFGLSNQMVVTFKEENTVSFKHLFLKGYMDSMDDTYAVYTQTEVYDQISFAINQFLQLRAILVGNHAYEKKGSEETPMAICQYFYKRGIISPGNDTFDIDPEIETDPKVPPVRLKPRRVPLPLLPKLDIQLDKLIAQGILVPVEQGPWETPIVTPLKPDGKIIQQTAPKTYIILLEDGRTWKRHIDHLRGRITPDNEQTANKNSSPQADSHTQPELFDYQMDSPRPEVSSNDSEPSSSSGIGATPTYPRPQARAPTRAQPQTRDHSEPSSSVEIPDANDLRRLVTLTLTFKLKAINLQTIRQHELPDCSDFTLTILFDNKAHSGRIKISLDNDIAIKECKDWHVSGSIQKNTHYMMIFDGFVILTCLALLILCTRSVIKGIYLQREFVTFFQHHYKKEVSFSDLVEFVNGWYIMIIVSDLLTIVGSTLKMEIQAKSLTSYDVCSILLGTSTMLVWLGVIRYLSFFKKYNLLILTLRAALPNVIQFCSCAAMIYLGYCFCGWIVLGPYHAKFHTLNMISEYLFSLINGDDMFATFAKMQQKSYLVWLFSWIYLYSFISLFIYMVLSLFIALITDTYETVKVHKHHYRIEGFLQTELHSFIAQCKDLQNSGRYRLEEESPINIFCCCKRLVTKGLGDSCII
ncbi:mucolipin-3-like [Erythrolamprus reginae]|uniref:mucolipin-3-like n=1 Tax=Erythrolamprus reginae TaxID=121349 RepID=UPI00396C975C